jgi:hypothetical protein
MAKSFSARHDRTFSRRSQAEAVANLETTDDADESQIAQIRIRIARACTLSPICGDICGFLCWSP